MEALKDLKQELKQQKEVACSVVNFDSGSYMPLMSTDSTFYFLAEPPR